MTTRAAIHTAMLGRLAALGVPLYRSNDRIPSDQLPAATLHDAGESASGQYGSRTRSLRMAVEYAGRAATDAAVWTDAPAAIEAVVAAVILPADLTASGAWESIAYTGSEIEPAQPGNTLWRVVVEFSISYR